ncbi:DMT family transporter [Diaphorobacter caeni]|uniref:DMT family transporter n=1 Tax=Diaphorobacter caeni TaxID=2784387 RepID=UPI0018901892|nr:EamA family transporter [Diaphorobacter caeni]MBF5005459.1 EamA family transporter [Diaphorobacter caeni]
MTQSATASSSTTPARPHSAGHVSSLLGVALVSAASLLWGTTGTVQSLGAGGLSPFWVGAAQLAVASVFFALVLVVSRQRIASRGLPLLPAPSRMGLKVGWFVIASAGVAGYSISFYAGVKLAGVAVGTAVAIGSSPIWAGLIQALVLRTPLSGLWWLGTAVSVGGGVAMVLSKGGAATAGISWFGLLLCLLAGLSYASYALVNKRLVAHAPTQLVNFYVFTGAAMLAVPAALLLAGPPVLSAASLLVIVYLGLVVSGVAYVLFSNGLRGISGPTGVTLTLIEPVAAFLLAVWVVGEHQPLVSWLGLLAVLMGLVVVIRAELLAVRADRKN